MTEKDAIRAVMWERWRRSFVLPRYSPRDWWECDVFELTKAGYFREFEVKLTVRDFHLDAKKTREAWPSKARWPREEMKLENKHALLAGGSPRGPVEFYFVTPEGLLAGETLPPWAGLVEVFKRGRGQRWWAVERRPAPRLHRTKLDEVIVKAARSTCYYRMHEALLRLGKRQ